MFHRQFGVRCDGEDYHCVHCRIICWASGENHLSPPVGYLERDPQAMDRCSLLRVKVPAVIKVSVVVKFLVCLNSQMNNLFINFNICDN
jgi:hypothetical protein